MSEEIQNTNEESTQDQAVQEVAVQEEEVKKARSLRKERIGIVTSSKMDKSITVIVERRTKHPIYKKFVKKTKKFMAHDEKNEANVGDKVSIMETRPLSKNKNWRLLSIIERAK